MIQCTPTGICSWNFTLEGDNHRALLIFDWWSEQGSIECDGVALDVRKENFWSGHWTLQQGGESLATALKASPFSRSFEVRDASARFDLYAESIFGRSFCLDRNDRKVAMFVPVHPFTRRATIEMQPAECDFTTVAFCFWLVVTIWRRQSKNSK